MTATFSPFDCMAAAETTRSGLLKCWDSEIEISWISSAELRSPEPLVALTEDNKVDETKQIWESACSELDILITTHRLAFVKTNEKQQRCIRYMHLSNVFGISNETILFKSPKLILPCSIGELIIAFPNGSDRTKRRDQCHDQLNTALQRAQWEQPVKNSTAGQPSSRRRVGVDAILNANHRRHQQAAQLTDTAFGGDAEQLLREATELVQVIQKYVSTLDKGSSAEDTDDTQALVHLMQGMGMTIHRDEQLARQLADFVRPKLQKMPFITLTDVFCWFNRARGSQLLSPEELLTAIQLMELLDLGIVSQKFASGLVVLHEERTEDTIMFERFWKRSKFLTAVQLSQDTHVPAVLAMEQLQLAEQKGILVRDETVETIRFYPNRFVDF